MVAASIRSCELVAVFGCMFFAIVVSPLYASTLPVPAGLQPGDHYYLLFFTQETTALSSDISTYNAIANEDANLLGYGSAAGVTWHAFVSTAKESVAANIPTSAYSVYNISYGLPADLIASDPLSLATKGALVPIGPGGWTTGESSSDPDVWTGINPTDLNDLSGGLGASFVTLGSGMLPGTSAIAGGGMVSDQSLVFYAISDPLTVPVPEPTTTALLVAAITCAAGAALYRRRRLNTAAW
jgi:hypothetical protein